MRLFQINIGASQGKLKNFLHLILFQTITDIQHMNGEANTQEYCPIIQEIFYSDISIF